MRWFALSALLLVSLGAQQPAATVSTSSESGIQVTVEPGGHFEIRTATPAWTFAGDVGQAVSNLRQSDGRDGIGAYRVVSFDTAGRGYGIRAYDSAPIVLFTTEYRATTNTPDTFPTLRTYPALPYRLS